MAGRVTIKNASNPRRELLTSSVSNSAKGFDPVTNKVVSNWGDDKIFSASEKLLTFVSNLPPFGLDETAEKLLTDLLVTLNRKYVLRVLRVIVSERAATWATIKFLARIEDMALSRIIKLLEERGLIVRACRIDPKGRGGGPRPTVYAVPNYTPEDIQHATTQHMILTSPLYREVYRLTQLFMDDYISPYQRREVSAAQDVIPFLRANSAGFPIRDLLRPFYDLLRERGVTVWE
jgi:hypothetical protein